MSKLKEEFEKAFKKEWGYTVDLDEEERNIVMWAFIQGLKKASEIVNKKIMSGDYKDCPAAWLNIAHKEFKKDILFAIKEMEA